MTNKLSNDIAALTSLSKRSMEDLFELAEYSIAHSVFESQAKGDCQTEIDIGFGTLFIRVDNNCLKYKFIPAESLKRSLADTLQSKSSPLLPKLEFSLKQRIEEAYKNLL